LYSCEIVTHVVTTSDGHRKPVAPQGSFHTLWEVAPQGGRPPDRPRWDLLHNPSPANPQGVHMLVPSDSTGCPQSVHIWRPSLVRAIPVTPDGRRTWVQPALKLGTTMGTTGPICGRLERGKNSSTVRPICPRVPHPGCTHAGTPSQQPRRHISTQSTTPITTAVLKSLEEKKKIKTGSGRNWGQLEATAALSTSRWRGRDDGVLVDGLTWEPTPGPRRRTPEPDRTKRRRLRPCRSGARSAAGVDLLGL
jgi:hypothetical protein